MSTFGLHKNDVAVAYDEYADMLYRLALTHLQNTEDAADAVQDVFVKYMHRKPVFKDREHERAWFIRVTVNCCHDKHRRRKVRDALSLEAVGDIAHEADGVDRDTLFTLMKSLESVEHKCRDAIVLHYLEGLSVDETAKALGISVSAVKMRLSRGRDALKTLMKTE